MTDAFIKLSDTDLRALITGLRSRRIAKPYSDLQLSRVLAPSLIQTVASGLTEFESLGFTSDQIAAVLELLERDRSAGRSTEPLIDLVTSGPEAPEISNRDTSVVVRELFAHACTSVLVVGYPHKEKVDLNTVAITMEHVMPQTIKGGKSAAAWKVMLGESWETVHNTWLHTLGNLTLSGYNQNLGNKPYDVKRAEFAKSHLVLNGHFASVEVWDEAAIKRRGAALAEEATGLWPRAAGGPGYDPPAVVKKETLTPEERRKRRREYWDGFLSVLRERNVLAKLPKAATSGWLFFPMGTTLFRLIAFADPGKRNVGVALICRGREGRANFETFRNERAVIEAKLGDSILWQEKPNGKTFHISLRRAESDSRDKAAWPQQFQWLAERIEAFHSVFSDRCKALTPEGKKKLSPEERRKRRQQYWSGLVEVLRERGSFETLPKASTSGWMNFPLGTSLFRLIAFARPSKKYVGMTLVCRGKKGRENFEAFRKEQSAIETEIGDQLVWEEMPNGKVFHLTLRRPASDTRDTTAWPQQHEWLADKAERFHSVFAERCQSMTPEEAKPKLRHKLRKKFWTGLLERAAAKTSLHADITPGAYHWAGTGAGMGGLGYNYVITKKGSTVELYIDRGKGQKTKNKQIFDTFKESQAEIDAVFGESLEWERLDSKRACRIVYRFENAGYRSPEEMWPEIQDEMIAAMVRLEKALSPHIAALKESV